ncbi:MAG TPA: hypothetical protein VNE16_09360 [Vicinamibacterales bacterium]|nr:hypothetical protein [Vicinamibacterales bacterium]
MSEAGIGRIVVASLHQAIADTLPSRLEFYENWLSAQGLRGGTVGVAQLQAVLSFLRLEGDAYGPVMNRAGAVAAGWTVDPHSATHRRLTAMMPARVRTRRALRLARHLVRSGSARSRAVIRRSRGTTSIELSHSLFCDVRTSVSYPLCGFYAAAAQRLLELYDVDAEVAVATCRGAGQADCVLAVNVKGSRTRTPPSVVAA